MVGCLGFQEQIVLFKCVCCLVFMVVFAVPCFSSWTVLFAQFFNRFSSPFCTKHASKSTHYLSRKKKGTTAFKKWAGEKKKTHTLFLKPSELYVLFSQNSPEVWSWHDIFLHLFGGRKFPSAFSSKVKRLFGLGFFCGTLKRWTRKAWKIWDKNRMWKGKISGHDQFSVFFNGIPASSKGFCLDPRDGVWAPLIIHSAPFGRSRQSIQGIFNWT